MDKQCNLWNWKTRRNTEAETEICHYCRHHTNGQAVIFHNLKFCDQQCMLRYLRTKGYYSLIRRWKARL